MDRTHKRSFGYAVGEVIRYHRLYWRQIIKLAKADIVKTYKGAALGWAWAIIRPAMTIAVYYFVFTIGLRSGKPVNGYPYMFYLLSGIIPWLYISGGINGGTSSIRGNKILVTKIKFPVCTIPTIGSVSKFMINLALIFLVLILFVVAGYGPSIYWVQLPLYLFLTFFFVTAWGLFAGVVTCFSVDFKHAVASLMRALFWFSGIFFNINRIDNVILRRILMINPTALLVEGYRNTLIYENWFWERPSHIILLVVECILMAMLGIHIYNKQRREIADVI